MENLAFIARYRQSDGTPQPLKEHLEGVADLAERFAATVSGRLLGWNHDPEKYSNELQGSIRR